MHLVTPRYRFPGHTSTCRMKDQLTHFQWLDRDKNEVVTDLIVINDAYLERTLFPLLGSDAKSELDKGILSRSKWFTLGKESSHQATSPHNRSYSSNCFQVGENVLSPNDGIDRHMLQNIDELEEKEVWL